MGEGGIFNPVESFGVGLGWMRERGPHGEVLFVELCGRGSHGSLRRAGECILVPQNLVVLTELLS